ncbi:hypothetical protein F5Y16DRAFT_358382 [Xylariaceae sp. FL0255]|nr:hypothetical protein F5Y16DRAFT_358382 [Xylariaceae sp. FL0255]
MTQPYANQKTTYLPYIRGIPPDDLRLGSLYLDIFNPNLGLEKLRFEFREKSLNSEKYWETIQQWTGEPEVDDIEPYILEFQASTEWALQAKVLDAAGVGADKSRARDVSIVGTKARRFQIKKPERFLFEQVLTQPDVKKWIADRLSISFWARWQHHRKTGEPWQAPSIWLVTGVILISDGRVHSGWNVGHGIEAHAGVDAGLIAGGVPTGHHAAKLHGSVSHNVQMSNLYGQSGERVWCAQFMKLAVDFTNGPKESLWKGWHLRLFPQQQVELLGLRQVENLGPSGVRRSTQSKAPLSIDWKNHQAIVKGLETIGAKTDTDVEAAPEYVEADQPLDKMVVSDLPYDERLSAQDWDTFQDYLTYVEYQH